LLVGCVNSVSARGRVRGPYSRAPVPLIPRSCLVLVVLVSGVQVRAPARPASSSFNRVQGAGDRRATASAGGTSSAGRSSAADEDRSCLPGCCESAVAAIALAVVSGHADDAPALASTAGRAPLDLGWSEWPAAYRPGDPRVGASPRARESVLGLPADRRRTERVGCRNTIAVPRLFDLPGDRVRVCLDFGGCGNLTG
jgi:hypothetical protein